MTDHLLDRLVVAVGTQYLVDAEIGRGGMAVVYRARDLRLNRRVAIKVLPPELAFNADVRERFLREAQTSAQLAHPGIVPIYMVDEAEGLVFFVMALVDGETLGERLLRERRLPVEQVRRILTDVADALAYAHANGVVHRDIKPDNIMLDRATGRAVVTDFGIARAGASDMTLTGSIMGTAQYLSPEQARGAAVDQRSDLYSVGIVLYEMLTGTVPFTGETPVEIAMRHLSDTPQPPSIQRPEIPPDLDMVVLRSLAKNPEDRFQTAEEMDAELERVAQGVGVTVETADAATAVLSGGALDTAPTAITPMRRPPAAARPSYRYADPPARKRPVWPWLLALLLVVLAGLAGWYAYGKIQNSLGGSGTVSVPPVIPLREDLAINRLRDKGLKSRLHRRPNETIKVGLVYDQNPAAGVRQEKGSTVDVYVSTGPPKVDVPDVKGDSRDTAVRKLTEAGLEANTVEVFSTETPGKVIAQFPEPGRRVRKGSKVRINVSRGVKPVTVPNVVGQPYDNAAGQLQAAGFAVARKDVDSVQPKGVVIDQKPRGAEGLSRGGTVTLYVSKGPKTSTIPDVTSQDEASARQTLERSGFTVVVQDQDTTDPNQDGIVLDQIPAGGTEAKPGSTVTIVVGRLLQP